MAQKMKTIKFKNGAVMRVPESVALPYLYSGEAHCVPKSTLRSFWKTQDRIKSNNNYLEKFDFSDKQDKNFLHKEADGKVFAYLHRKVEEKVEKIIPEKRGKEKLKWWQKISNALGLTKLKPKEVILEEGKLKMVLYPKYQKFLVGIQ